MRIVKSPIETNIWHESISSIMRRTDSAMRCIRRISEDSSNPQRKALYLNEVVDIVTFDESATLICKGDPTKLKTGLGLPDIIAGVPVRVNQAIQIDGGTYVAKLELDKINPMVFNFL